MQEVANAVAIIEKRSDEAISNHLVPWQEIASLAAPGTAQAGLSIAWRSHLLHAFRGTCTSMYISLAMTGNMN